MRVKFLGIFYNIIVRICNTEYMRKKEPLETTYCYKLNAGITFLSRRVHNMPI